MCLTLYSQSLLLCYVLYAGSVTRDFYFPCDIPGCQQLYCSSSWNFCPGKYFCGHNHSWWHLSTAFSVNIFGGIFVALSIIGVIYSIVLLVLLFLNIGYVNNKWWCFGRIVS